MKKFTRLSAADRRAQILTTALELAEQTHYLKTTRDDIAGELDLSGPGVQFHFGTMGNLRTELMRAAIDRENLTVLAQGLLAKDAMAAAAPLELKERALRSVLV